MRTCAIRAWVSVFNLHPLLQSGSGSKLEGDVLLGPSCCVGEDSLLSSCTLGDQCVVGKGAAVENCVLMRGVKIGDQSQVGHQAATQYRTYAWHIGTFAITPLSFLQVKGSVIGRNVVVGKGVVVSPRCVLGDNVNIPDGTVIPEETR